MNFNVEFFETKTIVTFKKKDFTNIDDVISMCSALANRHCFEAGSLLSSGFKDFIENIEHRKTYAVIVGHEVYSDKPVVKWGILEKTK